MSALCVLGVRSDDVAHQTVAHDVAIAQVAEPDPFDPGQDPLDLEQARILPVGQVDLGLVPRDHRPRVHSQAREEHFHLHSGRVLGLIENHEGVGEGATPHVGEWRDLDGAAVGRLLHPVAGHHVLQRVVQRSQVRVDLLVHVAGEELEALPASTAGRASTMRRTRLRARASTAIATARYVFPVPAGPMPITMSCCAIACRYSRCPAVFAWITRRSPGRMILYSPSGVRPVGPCSSWLTRRSTSATSSGSPPPMRTRSTSAWATGTARSTAGSGPCSISVSPRNDTRTPSRCASATRLPSFTPASASGSTPSVESRWVISSVMA